MNNLEGIPVHVLPDVQFLAADETIKFGEPSLNHQINFFALIWFLEDKGSHFIDFEPYPIKKDMVYLLSKNQVHAMPGRELPRARVIVFSTDFMHYISEPRLRQLFLPYDNNGIEIPAALSPSMRNLFALILMEYQGAGDINLLVKYTSAFLIHLSRFSAQRFTAAAGEDVRISKLFRLLEEHFTENRAASFYADHIGLTAKRINEILRKKTGTTLNSLINQLLLVESKRELFHRDLAIKEIAYKLGFADQSYFSRFFKKHTALTPDEFRQNARKNFQTT